MHVVIINEYEYEYYTLLFTISLIILFCYLSLTQRARDELCEQIIMIICILLWLCYYYSSIISLYAIKFIVYMFGFIILLIMKLFI